jgi:exopolysaccharide biosynthesis predicted pyruvyltransferase EpsI
VVVRDAARDTVDVFVETVRDAAEVHTDRLHVMLLAVMLGKPVIAYQTLYGKLEAVYEHSLKGMTGVNVTFRRFP